MRALKLDDRAVIKVTGSEAKSFLQGLITNDITTLTDDGILYAAILTPQGKYLFDFFIYDVGGSLYIECEAAASTPLIQRLTMYKMRADVTIEDQSATLTVYAIFEGPAEGALICVTDPRHNDFGMRALFERSAPKAEPLSRQKYETMRLERGIPDGARDMEANKTFALEANLDSFNGVSFTKGCYVGQEMTARMMHRTTRKKMLLPVTVAGGAPKSGTQIQTADGKSAGDVRSSQGEKAIAFLRLEYVDDPLTADGRVVTVCENI